METGNNNQPAKARDQPHNVIPDTVIEPKMTRKLVEMGRILHVDLPDTGDSAESVPVPTSDGAEGENDDEPDTSDDELTAADLIAGTGGEFACEKCGRSFHSQQGLAAHIRSHKE